VGHTPSITTELVAEFAHAWRARPSEHHLVFRSDWFDEIPDKVAAGELDVGLGSMFEAREDLELVALGRRPLRLAVPVDDRLAGRREVALLSSTTNRSSKRSGPRQMELTT
jgi:DNA-binding transcriptional LysR family regulator